MTEVFAYRELQLCFSSTSGRNSPVKADYQLIRLDARTALVLSQLGTVRRFFPLWPFPSSLLSCISISIHSSTRFARVGSMSGSGRGTWIMRSTSSKNERRTHPGSASVPNLTIGIRRSMGECSVNEKGSAGGNDGSCAPKTYLRDPRRVHDHVAYSVAKLWNYQVCRGQI